MLWFFSIMPFFSTTLGGTAALRFRHRLHPIMAFAAGVLVATAIVDLLPEAIGQLGTDEAPFHLGLFTVAGFLVFSALESTLHGETYEHQHEPHQDPREPHDHVSRPRSVVGIVGPASLVVHSTLDGLAIGLGFAANTQVGLVVALAVLAHDFADGMNVVTLALAGGQDRRFTITILVLDALAPPFGVLVSTAIHPEPAVLAALLATFAGVFIAIGAGHLLPEAQHQRPASAPPLVLLAGVGAVVVAVVRTLLG